MTTPLRGRHRTGRRWTVGFVLGTVLVGAACGGWVWLRGSAGWTELWQALPFGAPDAAGAPWAGRDRPTPSPREVVQQLIALRQAGAYPDMKPLIVPERVTEVINTLVAVQDFLGANDQLCELVRREVGGGLSQTIDRGRLAYDLDIFSRYVELLDERVAGDVATVGFLVDGQVPPRHAALRRCGQAWCYDPGPGDYRRLADAFERLARGLRQTADEIRSGRLPASALREDPDRLAEELAVRLLPGVKLLPPAPGG